MKNWLIQKLGLNESPDLSKRRIIKTGAQLAALCALGPLVNIKAREIERQLMNGVVHGQTFYLDAPIHIDFDYARIYGCTFIAMCDMPYMIKITGKYTTISDCYFDVYRN